MTRLAFVVAALVALALAVPWWIASVLLSGSYDSACEDSVQADMTFYAANLGVLLALGALLDAALTKRPRYAGPLLGIYLVLGVASFVAGATCD